GPHLCPDLRSPRPPFERVQRVSIDYSWWAHVSADPHAAWGGDQLPRSYRSLNSSEPAHDRSAFAPHASRLGSHLQRRRSQAERANGRSSVVPASGERTIERKP